jgi:hypothetical protein
MMVIITDLRLVNRIVINEQRVRLMMDVWDQGLGIIILNLMILDMKIEGEYYINLFT